MDHENYVPEWIKTAVEAVTPCPIRHYWIVRENEAHVVVQSDLTGITTCYTVKRAETTVMKEASF